MERREPTFSSGASSSESGDTSAHRSVARGQEPAHHSASKSSYQASLNQPSSNRTATLALVIGLVAALGAGYLGSQFFKASTQLDQAVVRIEGLEKQLSLTSEESSASVVTLQANIKKMDSDLRKLIDTVEANRKALAEKISAVDKEMKAADKTITDLKTNLASTKTQTEGNKTAVDGLVTKLDETVAASAKATQDLKEELDKTQLEMTSLDGVAARVRSIEDAIKSIDDYRRSTNREILQIKQQLGTAPAAPK
jgi:chromosome segregation ATPase